MGGQYLLVERMGGVEAVGVGSEPVGRNLHGTHSTGVFPARQNRQPMKQLNQGVGGSRAYCPATTHALRRVDVAKPPKVL
jgi:hypothetical protein